MVKIKPKTIDEYIDLSPEDGRLHLLKIRYLINEIAPEVEEKIKWGLPVYEGKRILFSMAAYKSHLNFMPTGQTLDHFREELKDYKMGKDTIQLPYDKPIPVDLIRKLIEHRMVDVNENDAKWKY